jgi:hypothetical protein
MNTHIIKISFFLSVLPLMACGEDERPLLKQSPAMLIGVIQTMAEANIAAARVNVAHDVAHKRLRIFSITPNVKTGEFKEFGYDLEIVYNADLASLKSGVSSYRFQNNNYVLSFAAAQFVSGNKAFAKRLVAILAEAEPNLCWFSPTNPVITIKHILVGLEKDDDTVKPFLKDWGQDWAETVKRYGP